MAAPQWKPAGKVAMVPASGVAGVEPPPQAASSQRGRAARRARIAAMVSKLCEARGMKHIGIVACSAEGAALCYQTICRDALALVGKNDHPQVTLSSIPMARWLPAFEAKDYRA